MLKVTERILGERQWVIYRDGERYCKAVIHPGGCIAEPGDVDEQDVCLTWPMIADIYRRGKEAGWIKEEE